MYSLEVKALDSAPIESKVSETSRAESFSEPLNRRCSKKCETPASLGISSRVPVSIQQPRATERSEGMGSEITRSPLGSVVRS